MVAALAACGGNETSDDGSSSGSGGSSSGSAGSAGASGSDAGKGGSAGNTGGKGGSAGSAGASGSGGNAGTSGDGGTGAAPNLVDCDHRKVLCKSIEPTCPEMQVASVEESCWGSCVPIDECACGSADECPHEETYTCWSGEHCGPYVR